MGIKTIDYLKVIEYLNIALISKINFKGQKQSHSYLINKHVLYFVFLFYQLLRVFFLKVIY